MEGHFLADPSSQPDTWDSLDFSEDAPKAGFTVDPLGVGPTPPLGPDPPAFKGAPAGHTKGDGGGQERREASSESPGRVGGLAPVAGGGRGAGELHAQQPLAAYEAQARRQRAPVDMDCFEMVQYEMGTLPGLHAGPMAPTWDVGHLGAARPGRGSPAAPRMAEAVPRDNAAAGTQQTMAQGLAGALTAEPSSLRDLQTKGHHDVLGLPMGPLAHAYSLPLGPASPAFGLPDGVGSLAGQGLALQDSSSGQGLPELSHWAVQDLVEHGEAGDAKNSFGSSPAKSYRAGQGIMQAHHGVKAPSDAAHEAAKPQGSAPAGIEQGPTVSLQRLPRALPRANSKLEGQGVLDPSRQQHGSPQRHTAVSGLPTTPLASSPQAGTGSAGMTHVQQVPSVGATAAPWGPLQRLDQLQQQQSRPQRSHPVLLQMPNLKGCPLAAPSRPRQAVHQVLPGQARPSQAGSIDIASGVATRAQEFPSPSAFPHSRRTVMAPLHLAQSWPVRERPSNDPLTWPTAGAPARASVPSTASLLDAPMAPSTAVGFLPRAGSSPGPTASPVRALQEYRQGQAMHDSPGRQSARRRRLTHSQVYAEGDGISDKALKRTGGESASVGLQSTESKPDISRNLPQTGDPEAARMGQRKRLLFSDAMLPPASVGAALRIPSALRQELRGQHQHGAAEEHTGAGWGHRQGGHGGLLGSQSLGASWSLQGTSAVAPLLSEHGADLPFRTFSAPSSWTAQLVPPSEPRRRSQGAIPIQGPSMQPGRQPGSFPAPAPIPRLPSSGGLQSPSSQSTHSTSSLGTDRAGSTLASAQESEQVLSLEAQLAELSTQASSTSSMLEEPAVSEAIRAYLHRTSKGAHPPK